MNKIVFTLEELEQQLEGLEKSLDKCFGMYTEEDDELRKSLLRGRGKQLQDSIAGKKGLIKGVKSGKIKVERASELPRKRCVI
jgi:hypothetical protein